MATLDDLVKAVADGFKAMREEMQEHRVALAEYTRSNEERLGVHQRELERLGRKINEGESRVAGH